MVVCRDGLEDPLEDHGVISQQLEQVYVGNRLYKLIHKSYSFSHDHCD
jgi:hypothetical protein